MDYTKGEWKVTLGGVDLPEHQRIVISELGIGESGIMNIRTICKTLDYGEPEEMVANAQLIASAPDMYEALKGLADCKLTMAEFLLAMNKVLAKAEGK